MKKSIKLFISFILSFLLVFGLFSNIKVAYAAGEPVVVLEKNEGLSTESNLAIDLCIDNFTTTIYFFEIRFEANDNLQNIQGNIEYSFTDTYKNKFDGTFSVQKNNEMVIQFTSSSTEFELTNSHILTFNIPTSNLECTTLDFTVDVNSSCYGVDDMDLEEFSFATSTYSFDISSGSQAQGYTLTFNNNGYGDTPSTQANVTTLPTLPVLTSPGYTFGGWYYDSELTQAASVGDTITKNTSLYAKWTEAVVTPDPEPIYENTTVALEVVSQPNSNGEFTLKVSIKGPEANEILITSFYTTFGIVVDGTLTSIADLYYDDLLGQYLEYVSSNVLYQTGARFDSDEFQACISSDNNPVNVNNCDIIEVTFKLASGVDNLEMGLLSGNDYTSLKRLMSGDNHDYEYVVSDNVTITKTEQSSGYTVTFYTNGYGASQEDLINVTTLPTLPVLTSTGYTFGGWYYDSELTQAASAGDTITKNTALYAKWTEDVATPDPEPIYENTTVVLEVVSQPNSNGEFTLKVSIKGPEANEILITSFYTTFGIVVDGELISLDVLLYEYDTLNQYLEYVSSNVLYQTGARFDEDNFQACISSDNNPVNVNNCDIIEVTFKLASGVDSLEMGLVSGDGYTSLRRLMSNDNEIYEYVISDNVTITRGSYYSVTFDTDGGTSVSSPVYTDVVSSCPVTTKSGYTFLGWYINDELVSFPYTVTSNVTMVAKWQDDSGIVPVEYTLTLDPNGGTLSQTTYNGTVDVEPVPTYNGYRFLGWYDVNDNLILFPYTVISDITLYAHWEQINNDEDIENNRIIMKDAGNNSVDIYIQNPNNSVIQNGFIRFDFADKAIIKGFTPSEYIIVNVTNNCELTISMEKTMNNSYIYLGRMELESQNKAANVTISITTLEDDISTYLTEALTIEFVVVDTEIYYYYSIDNKNINQSIFTIDLKLHNGNNDKINSGTIVLSLPSGLRVIGFEKGDFEVAVFKLNTNTIEFFINDLNSYLDNLDMLVGTLTIVNDSLVGNYTLTFDSFQITDIYENYLEENAQTTSIELVFSLPETELDSDTSLQVKIDDGSYVTVTGDSYTFDAVSKDTQSVTLDALVKDTSYVKIGVNGQLLTGNSTSNIALTLGENNNVVVYVTALDGTTKEYTIIIPRLGEEEETKATIKLEIELTDKNYDIYYNGLVGINVYVNNASYDVFGTYLVLSYDTNVFELVFDQTKTYNSFTTNLIDSNIIEFNGQAYGNSLLIGTIYFKLKNNPSASGNYTFGLSNESRVYADSAVEKEALFETCTLNVINGVKPEITGIKITKKDNSNIVIYQSTSFTYDELGNIVIPEIDYIYDFVDIYITTTSGVILLLNDEVYNVKYNVSLEEYSYEINANLSYNDSYTTNSYKILLTRSTGDSTNTLDEIAVTYNDTDYTATIVKTADNTYKATLDDKIKYIYRENVVVNVVKTSSLSTVTGLEASYSLIVGKNTIVITVTSQNGSVATYNLELEVEDKKNITITGDNIESLSKVFDNTSITSNDVILQASFNGNVVTGFVSNIVIKDSDDNVITNALNVGTYTVIAYIEGNDTYLESDKVVKTFTISALEATEVSVDLENTTFTYTGSIIKPTVLAVTVNGIYELESTDYIVSYGDDSTNKNVGTNAYVKITGVGNYSFEKTINFEITAKSLLDEDVNFEVIDKAYTGNSIELISSDITSSFAGGAITSSDYEILSYSNNIEKGLATVVIKGIGNFKDQINVNFNITAIDISEDNTTVAIVDAVDGVYSVFYNGLEQKPAINVYVNDVLVSSSNYTVSYSNNINAGTAYISITAKDNSSIIGSIENAVSFTINQITINDDTYIQHEEILDGVYTYTGSAHTPTPKIYYSGKELKEGVDFSYSYSDNIEAGLATITITGLGNFKDSFDITFNISKVKVSISNFSYDLEYTSTIYSGLAKKPSISNIVLTGFNDITVDDLLVEYSNNINVGTATIKVSLLSESFEGYVERTFVINKLSLDDTSIKFVYSSNTPESLIYTYSGLMCLPSYELWLYDGENQLLKIEASEYSISYPDTLNFIDAGIKNVRLTAKDTSTNFTGIKEFSYEILKASINDVIIDEIVDQTYTGDYITPAITVRFNNKILNSSQYTYEYVLDTNKNIGVAKAIFRGLENFTGEVEFDLFNIVSDPNAEYSVEIEYSELVYNGLEQKQSVTIKLNDVVIDSSNYDVLYPTDLTNVGIKEITINGKNNLDGIVLSTSYEITPKSLKSSDITYDEILDQVFTNKEIKPNVIIKDNGNVIDSSYLTITYSDNVNVSSNVANIAVTGINNYKDTLNIKFNIVPLTNLDESVSISLSQSEYTYANTYFEPSVIFTINGVEVSVDDYDVNYENNLNAGTAKAIITGNRNLEGFIKEIEFNISSKEFASNNELLDGFELYDIPTQGYTGSEIIPDINLFDGKYQLIKDVDFELVLSNNTNVTTSESKATVVIRGINNYSGELTREFEIAKQSDVIAELNIDSFEYTGSAIEINPTNLRFTNSNGDELSLVYGEDYELSYLNNVNVAYSGNDIIANASVKITFINSYEGFKSLNYKITPKSINGYYVEGILGEYEYTGEAIKPSFNVYVDEELQNLFDSSNYSVAYFNSTNISTTNKAFVSITGIGNYKDTITVEFSVIKKQCSDDEIEIEFTNVSNTYTGLSIIPTYNIKVNGKLLDITSTIKYYSDIECENELTEIIDANVYYVLISFDSENIGGSKLKEFEITKATLQESFIQGDIEFTYNGQAVEIKNSDLSLKYLTNTLTLDTDFELVYEAKMNVEDNIELIINGIGNYTGSITTVYSIKKANYSIIADDKTSKYLEDIVELTYQVNGEIYNEDDLGISITTTAKNTSNVGSYDITITASNPNYNITIVNGVYEITKAVITDEIIKSQTKNYTGKTIMPSLLIELPSEVSVTFYDSSFNEFVGAIAEADYSLIARFTVSSNYEAIEDIHFVLTIAAPKVIELKEDSTMSFMYLRVEVDRRGAKKYYSTSYYAKGFTHGLDDLEENGNGINSSRVIIGQISVKTSVKKFLESLGTDLSLIRITDASGKVLHNCSSTISSTLSRKYMGTGYKVEYVMDGSVRDTAYISVLGDTNGDGNVNALDYDFVKNYILGSTTTNSDEVMLAITFNTSGKISSIDYEAIKKVVLGTKKTDEYFYPNPFNQTETVSLMSLSLDEECVESNEQIKTISLSENDNVEIIEQNNDIIIVEESNDSSIVEERNEQIEAISLNNLSIDEQNDSIIANESNELDIYYENEESNSEEVNLIGEEVIIYNDKKSLLEASLIVEEVPISSNEKKYLLLNSTSSEGELIL